MKMYQKFIPDYYFNSILEIPYQLLKEQGVSTLFFDLDNTIIGYDEDELRQSQIDLFNELSQTFKILIISNSGYKRVSTALSKTTLPFVHHAFKPFKCGFRKAIKKIDSKKEEIVVIGDQLLTDVYGSHRIGLKIGLVKSVKRTSDRFVTKINRMMERYILKKIKRKHPLLYKERLEDYVNDHKM